jgi:hypothetical protein
VAEDTFDVRLLTPNMRFLAEVTINIFLLFLHVESKGVRLVLVVTKAQFCTRAVYVQKLILPKRGH